MYKDQNHIMKFLRDTLAMRFLDFEDVSGIFIREVTGKIDLNTLKDYPISQMTPYEPGTIYETESNKYHMFKFKLKVPPKYDNKPFVLKCITGFGVDWHDYKNPNFLLFVNGQPLQAFDTAHRECVITNSAKAYEEYDCFLFSFGGMRKGPLQLTLKMSTMDLKTDKIYYDVLSPFESIEYIESEAIKRDTQNYLVTAINIVDFRQPYSKDYYDSLEKASTYLEEEYYGKYCDDDTSQVNVAAVGHTHIDVAWLWPLKETRQKTVRSFTSQLKNIEDYDHFHFLASQPQLYKFIEEEYPDLLDRIKKAVEDGKWEAEGAMWLEADCNLISGESLVRQIMHGKKYFKDKFNVDSRLLFLPDVFGYSAALPQVLRKSGVDYFTTSKISWNEFNTVPYNTFMWEGIDGTEVFTNFIVGGAGVDKKGKPRVNYTAQVTAENVMGTWNNYRDKSLAKNPLMTFGLGDGGGGPSRDNLEQLKRFSRGIKGMPKVTNAPIMEYFDNLYNEVKDNKRLPKWVGELYLEYHRGTYTSMAKNKKFNRQSEQILRDGELFNSLADRFKMLSYDKKRFFDSWEKVLLHQFHDILPGTSIKEVYDDSDRDYKTVLKDAKSLLHGALSAFTKTVKGHDLCVVFNQLAFKRIDLVKMATDKDYTCVYDHKGDMIPGQMVEEDNRKYFIFEARLCAMGYTVFKLSKDYCGNKDKDFKVDTHLLENSYLKVTFDENMNISSLYDKNEEREVLLENQVGNRLTAFEDKPLRWQAWDVEIYYNDKPYHIDNVISAQVVEDGPVRKAIRIEREFSNSSIVQDIYLEKSSKKLDFKTRVECNDDDLLLKAAFPVDVHANEATYEIQFGNVKRPTHWNTSWDYARFEVCAHKWADLSEDNYGVSLLNDCKYGHDIKGSVMRLTLLKSGVDPFPEADRGLHNFTYSIYPHSGDFKKAHTVDMAYKLNHKPYAYYVEEGQGDVQDYQSYLECANENVVVDTVKKSLDGEETIIRVYECFNRRTQCEIKLNFDVFSIKECDLMENDIQDMKIEDGLLKFTIMPYEIKTFKLS